MRLNDTAGFEWLSYPRNCGTIRLKAKLAAIASYHEIIYALRKVNRPLSFFMSLNLLFITRNKAHDWFF